MIGPIWTNSKLPGSKTNPHNAGVQGSQDQRLTQSPLEPDQDWPGWTGLGPRPMLTPTGPRQKIFLTFLFFCRKRYSLLFFFGKDILY